jgi:dTMP kinase
MPKGRFIVIDGTDGSGKATQVAILEERLKKEGQQVAVVDFPRYDQPSSFFVKKYLNGEYGSLEEIGPKLGSIFYALDRFDAKFEIKKQLEAGKILLANRYVSANMGHQGSKITDPQTRKEFLDWLYNLEYDLLQISRPDLNIILHVSPEISQQLVDKKGHRDYVGGQKRDLHEASLAHLQAAEAAYLYVAKTYPDFCLIECVKNEQIMSKEEIHELIWEKVKELL